MFLDKRSSRHHYIPKFILNGFTSSDNRFYVYDKEKDTILKKKYSPKQVCFEWDRNTAKTLETVTSGIEDVVYNRFDSRAGKLIEAIKKSTPNSDIWNQENIYIVKYFIAQLYWRSPLQDKKILEIHKNNPLSYTGLRFVKNNSESPISNAKIEQTLKKDEFVKKYYQILLALKSVSNPEGFDDKNWRAIYLNTRGQIITDNPIIYREEPEEDKDIAGNDLLLPISNKRTIINIPSSKKSIDPRQRYYQEIVLIFQAKKYVCCSELDYLTTFVGEYRKLRCSNPYEELKNELFNFF